MADVDGAAPEPAPQPEVAQPTEEAPQDASPAAQAPAEPQEGAAAAEPPAEPAAAAPDAPQDAPAAENEPKEAPAAADAPADAPQEAPAAAQGSASSPSSRQGASSPPGGRARPPAGRFAGSGELGMEDTVGPTGAGETLRDVRPRRRAPASPSPPEPSLREMSKSMGDLSFNSKQPSHMGVLAGFHSGPAVTMGGRVAAGSFIRTNSNPGPGSYDMNRRGHHSKYSSQPRYSFGGSNRFGLGVNSNQRPGPGHYGSPKDPTLERVPRAGFGGAPRADLADRRGGPGPGAYELKSCLGEGKMFTAGGRFYGSGERSRMLPGPGAYEPVDRMSGKYAASPKVGFGTSTRDDFAARREAGKPGPGTYNMAAQKAVGTDSSKFSIRSRRKVHDLTSYLEPGPGHYASHVSSFAGKVYQG